MRCALGIDRQRREVGLPVISPQDMGIGEQALETAVAVDPPRRRKAEMRCRDFIFRSSDGRNSEPLAIPG